MKLFFRAGFIILFALLLAAGGSRAEIASINVFPTVNKIALSRGETRSGTYAVFNKSDKDLHIRIEPRYWHPTEQSKDIPLDSWLKISPTEFDLAVGQNRDIPYEVSVPEGAQGELVAMIAFNPLPKEGEQALNVVFSVSVYLKIKGSENAEHEIDNFKIWKIKERKALGAHVTLKNTGNIHLRPRIAVHIQDFIGEHLKTMHLKFGTPVYPGKTEDYKGSVYNIGLKPGLYRAVVDLKYTDTTGIFQKRIYFIVGRGGRVWYTFFRRPKR